MVTARPLLGGGTWPLGATPLLGVVGALAPLRAAGRARHSTPLLGSEEWSHAGRAFQRGTALVAWGLRWRGLWVNSCGRPAVH